MQPATIIVDEGPKVKFTHEQLNSLRPAGVFPLTPQTDDPPVDLRSKTKPDTTSINGSIVSMDWHSAGTHLIVATSTNQLHYIDATRCTITKKIQLENQQINIVRFTHHASMVIIGCTRNDTNESSLYLLSLNDNTILMMYNEHRLLILDIILNPCHDSFITVSIDNTIKICDMRIPTPLGLIRSQVAPSIAIDPQGIVLCVGADNNCIKLYDIRTIESGPFSIFYLTSIIPLVFTSLGFSSDGSMIIVGGSPLSSSFFSSSSSNNIDPLHNPPVDDVNVDTISQYHDHVLLLDAFNGLILNKMVIPQTKRRLSIHTLQTLGAPLSMINAAENPIPVSSSDYDIPYTIKPTLTPCCRYIALGTRVGSIPIYTTSSNQQILTLYHKSQYPITHIVWNPTRTCLVSIDSAEIVLWYPSIPPL